MFTTDPENTAKIFEIWEAERLNIELDYSMVDTANCLFTVGSIASIAAEQEFLQDLDLDRELGSSINL